MIDKKDKLIMDILQYDGRISLTDLSKKINLSIDSTHKRLKKLIKQEIIFPTILIDPRKVGYPLIVDVKIKLKDIDEEKYKKLGYNSWKKKFREIFLSIFQKME